MVAVAAIAAGGDVVLHLQLRDSISLNFLHFYTPVLTVLSPDQEPLAIFI